MIRAFMLIVACLLAPLTARSAQPPAIYAIPGGVAGAGWLDDGRIWFVGGVHGSQGLEYTGPACPPAESCVAWGIIDPARDAIVNLGAQRGLRAWQAERIGDRIYISAQPTAGSLPQHPTALPPPLDATRYLLVVDPDGGVRFGSGLPLEFNLQRIVAVADDVVLAGSAPCPECGLPPNYERTWRTRLLRLDRELGALRYDRVLPGRWSPTAHAVDDAGRIHFGAVGRDLPIGPRSALPWRPTAPAILDAYHYGGVVSVEAADGELVNATYLHIESPVRVAWDPARDSIWVVASTFDTRFPLTVDAGDPLFCEPGTCRPQCGPVFTGIHCRFSKEIALAQLSSDGSAIHHATFIGGPGSDTPRALSVATSGVVTVLGLQERLGDGFSTMELGPRQITMLRPETGLHRGPQDDPIAALTAYSVAHANDARYGDLFARWNMTWSPAPSGVIPLHPSCNVPVTAAYPCVFLVWTPHFGNAGFAPQPIPVDRRAIVMLILALVFSAGVAIRRRTAFDPTESRS